MKKFITETGDQRTMLEEVFAALVSSDWGSVADIEIEVDGIPEDSQPDTIVVGREGRRFTVLVQEQKR